MRAKRECPECEEDGLTATVRCKNSFCTNYVADKHTIVSDGENYMAVQTNGYIQEDPLEIINQEISPRQKKWDLRFLALASMYGSWSKDPSSKVGAVIADDNLQVSQGYNGFPKGCNDDPAIYADRERKYFRIIHAERNALHYSDRDSHEGCTMYCTLPSCCQCTGDIITTGIKRLVYYKPTDDYVERWKASINEATKMCREAGVEIVVYDKNDNDQEWL